MTTTTSELDSLLRLLGDRDVIQLGQILQHGTQRYGVAPPFMRSLTSRHGERIVVVPGQSPDISSASDAFSMGTHTGTHMDSLSHVSYRGGLADGTHIDEPGVQGDATGVRMKTREAFSPIVSRGVLLDFTAARGVTRLPRDAELTAADFEGCCQALGVDVRAGDTVLVRTGWDTLCDDAEAYLSMPIPGPGVEAARWLAERKIVATGSDTMPYEAAPGSSPMEPHSILIPQSGIFIFEMMDLKELAARKIYEFLFVALPLRIDGGTGSPINPIALVPKAT